MRRREFITLVGGAAVAWPLAARAQHASEIPRFGFVYQGSQAAMALRIEAILSGLRVSGYPAPAQVEIVGRAAEGDPARIAPLVAEVIGKNVSVIMASGPLILNATRSATRTIPIVAIDFETDPSPAVWQLALRDQGATSLAYSSTFQTSRRSGWRC
jgi:putative ABC transport system substrate-binding protein